MIDLVFKNNTTDRKWTRAFFVKILDKAKKEKSLDLKTDKKYGVSINLVGEGKIKTLNKKHRGKNKVTDVLSFPLDDFRASKGINNNDIIDLGDIFICLPFAKKTAKHENSSLESKLEFLTIHGFLHLLGFDHERSERERNNMFKIQSNILEKIIF